MVKETLFFLYYNGVGVTNFLLNFLYNDYYPERYRTEKEINNKPTEDEMQFLLEICKMNFCVESIDVIYVRKFLETYGAHLLSNLLMGIVNSTCMYFLMD